ncbi:MAG TPA: NAD(P)-binding domain-containing protein [Burkholderiaceae bacterium]|nr:NAD(P)-binding domain-containing protein [Burkholderiaceae bacterium]
MTLLNAAIIGAGPYGLSLAAHLRAAGISCEVLGRPMHSWDARMPRGMVLRSEPFASSLWDPKRLFTYQRYCATHSLPYEPVGLPPSRERFLEYARWFQRVAVGEVAGGMARNIRRAPEGFSITLDDGQRLATRNVILATGYMAFRHVPEALAGLSWPVLVHSSMMDDVAAYAGQDVAVVGAGQSALESAALLHEAGAHVRLLARRAKIKWNGGPKPDRSWWDALARPHAGLGSGWKELAISELPQVFRSLFPADKRHRYVRDSWGPSGAWWLRERVDGRIDARLQCTPVATRMERGQAVIDVRENGTSGLASIAADRVIAATGFRVDLARLDYLDPTLLAEVEREETAPRLDASFETSVPGLFVVGAASAPTFGPVMRFMFGAKHAAPAVTRRLQQAA